MSEPNQNEPNLMSEWAKAFSRAAGQFGGNPMMQKGEEVLATVQDLLRKSFEQWVNGDLFLGGVSKAQGGTNLFRAQMEKLIEAQLAALHLPNRSDMEDLRQRLRSLDDRLEDLGDQVSELSRQVEGLSGQLSSKRK